MQISTFGLAYSPLNSVKLRCSSEVTLKYVHILVHSHFDLVSFVVIELVTRTVVEIATQIIIWCTIFLYLKSDRGKSCIFCVSNTPFKNFWNTVFPRIVSAETILFWIYPYELWPLITVHTGAETIQGRKLFKGGN